MILVDWQVGSQSDYRQIEDRKPKSLLRSNLLVDWSQFSEKLENMRNEKFKIENKVGTVLTAPQID